MKTWHIDASAIEVENAPFKFFLEIDGAARAELAAVPQRVPLPWKGRDVELRVDGPKNGLMWAVWADGVRVPESSGPSGRAERDEVCRAHEDKRAVRVCPGCEVGFCRRCLAPDGVRCDACFHARGATDESKLTLQWRLGAALLWVIALAMYAFVPLETMAEYHLGKISGGLLFGGGYMLYASFRQYAGERAPTVLAAFDEQDATPRSRKRGPDWDAIFDGGE